MAKLRPPRIRRSAEIDEAILGTYLAGASGHRIGGGWTQSRRSRQSRLAHL